MRNQILQRSEHGLLPKEDHFHDSLCVFYPSIFFIIVSYSKGTVAPYKLPKQENTKAEHCSKRMEKYTIMVSSFSCRPVDRKLRRHNQDQLPY